MNGERLSKCLLEIWRNGKSPCTSVCCKHFGLELFFPIFTSRQFFAEQIILGDGGVVRFSVLKSKLAMRASGSKSDGRVCCVAINTPKIFYVSMQWSLYFVGEKKIKQVLHPGNPNLAKRKTAFCSLLSFIYVWAYGFIFIKPVRTRTLFLKTKLKSDTPGKLN